MVESKHAPGQLSPHDVATLDLHPRDDGTIRIGPYVYQWNEEAEAWTRVIDIDHAPKRKPV